jgi:uncharacterized membrane protein
MNGFRNYFICSFIVLFLGIIMDKMQSSSYVINGRFGELFLNGRHVFLCGFFMIFIGIVTYFGKDIKKNN